MAVESVRNVALMWMETHYLPFAELFGTLVDGVPAAERALGMPFFDWIGQNFGSVDTFSAAMAELLRAVRGTVFDLPHVVAAAPAVLERHGVADRIGAEGGDIFAAVPAGADCSLACFILHDWNDEQATRILGRIHEAAMSTPLRLGGAENWRRGWPQSSPRARSHAHATARLSLGWPELTVCA